MHNRYVRAVALVSMLSLVASALAEETPQQREQRMQWWREARFGMFIHWGPVSLKGTEIGWSRGGERRGFGGHGNEIPVDVYDSLYKQFNPVKFDAGQWVRIAREAGMNYMVFTSRHHDGFSMFDTKADDYRITSPQSPFGRDVVKELADAAHKEGMRFGLYYSQPNWHHPDAYTERHEKYQEYLRTQVRELMSNYGKIDVLWYDGLGRPGKDYDSERLNALARQLQPQIIINNRNGAAEDFDTPEQSIGGFHMERPWESCITICQQWAWKPDDHMKSLAECVRTLVWCAGGDGNLLLNVGPMPTGEIEPRQVERLREIGQWLKKNGASIYATRGGPFRPGPWGASTRKGSTIYVHVMKWPADGIEMSPLPKKVLSAQVLSGGKAEFKQDEEGLTLKVAAEIQDPIDTVIALELDGPALDIKPLPGPRSHSLSLGAKATASNVYQKNSAYAADKAADGDAGSRWATDAHTHQAWIELDLGKEKTFGRIRIVQEEPYAGRIQKFNVQYKADGEWKTLLEGAKTTPDFTASFETVTAQHVRLNIVDATEGPTISEIELLPPAR